MTCVRFAKSVIDIEDCTRSSIWYIYNRYLPLRGRKSVGERERVYCSVDQHHEKEDFSLDIA
jgi:hypothetical protein